MLGATLGHYRVLSKIGAGGMGEVYLLVISRNSTRKPSTIQRSVSDLPFAAAA